MIYRLSMRRDKGRLVGFVIRELYIEKAVSERVPRAKIEFIAFDPDGAVRLRSQFMPTADLKLLKKTNKKEIIGTLFKSFGE